MKTIYLDYAATTPLDPHVSEKMQTCLTMDGVFGNPSSTHVFGQAALEAVQQARKSVASVIQAEMDEIIWTSGATEANNLALKGVAELYQQKGKHIVTLKTEHPSVLDCCQHLQKKGFEITYLDVERNGLLNLENLKSALRPDTILVSVMHVNNEIGVIQDIASIGKITSERNILFHVDAAQSAGKIPIDVNAMHIDLLSLSAHKIYGPKGIGALYLRKKPRIRVASQMHGGGHESGMRSGTLPTHQIVGMGEAFSLAKKSMQKDQERITQFSKRFFDALKNSSKIFFNTDPNCSIPNIINFGIHGMKSGDIMQKLPVLAISSGSACHSKGVEPSYVLRALGLSFEEAASSVRLSFGRFTTEEETSFAITSVAKTLSLSE